MNSKKILVAVVLAISLFGCGADKKNNDTIKNDSNTANVFKNDMDSQTDGSLQAGYIDAEKNPNISYTYDGKDLMIPYYILNDFNRSTTIGIVIFVDGIPQKYVTDDQKKPSFIQQWTLKSNERKNLKLQFTPSTGLKGTLSGLYVGTVFKPDFKATKEKPTYGNNSDINFTTPLNLNYNANVPNTPSYKTQNLVSNTSYKPEGLSENDSITNSMAMDFILPKNQEMNLYQAKNYMYNISFTMKGGSNTHYKVVAFVDNAPIQINDNDYLSVEMKEGKMLTYNFKLDAHNLPSTSTLFMIAIPDGKGYTQDNADTSQSGRILLVNEAKQK